MLQLNNNKYAALAVKDNDEDNDTISTGGESDNKFTRVQHEDKTKEWIATTRARNMEAREQLTNWTNYHSLRRS